VYLHAAERERAASIAAAAGVPFTGIWLDAPDEILRDRVDRRSGDASDADASVIQLQRSRHRDAIHWHRIEADSSPADAAARARQGLSAGW
jgi:uncharacterized protein